MNQTDICTKFEQYIGRDLYDVYIRQSNNTWINATTTFRTVRPEAVSGGGVYWEPKPQRMSEEELSTGKISPISNFEHTEYIFAKYADGWKRWQIAANQETNTVLVIYDWRQRREEVIESPLIAQRLEDDDIPATSTHQKRGYRWRGE